MTLGVTIGQNSILRVKRFQGTNSVGPYAMGFASPADNENLIEVKKNNAILQQDDFTISGSNITFAASVATTDDIEIKLYDSLGSSMQPDDQSVGRDQIQPTLLEVVTQSQRTDDGAVNTGTTILPDDDTIPQITEGDEYLSQTITPTKAGNKIKVRAAVHLAHSVSTVLTACLFKVGTNDALVCTFQGSNTREAFHLDYEMTAPDLTAITFKVRGGGAAAGTTTFNGVGAARKLGGVLNSFIEVTEVLQ